MSAPPAGSARDAPGRRRVFVVGLIALFAVGCDGSSNSTPTSPGPPATTPLPLELVTANFRLVYSEESASLIQDYATELEANRQRVMDELGVTSLSRIEGRFYPDPASFTAATGFQAGGSVGGPNLFHLVAIPYAPSNAVHEFAHNVSMHVDRDIPNNPTWLWESVAIYESRQFVDPRSVPFLVAGDFPTMDQLDDRNGSYSIYLVGYTIAETIVDRWGLDGLRAMIVAHGDTQSALGLSRAQFEARWRSFVEERYL